MEGLIELTDDLFGFQCSVLCLKEATEQKYYNNKIVRNVSDLLRETY